MKNTQLKPEEKLFNAIFGWSGFREKPFLSPEGCQSVIDTLKHFEETNDLGRRSVRVLRLRFGLEPVTDEEKQRRKPTPWRESNSRSLDEVAPYLGVTRERIRQIEARSLRQLRHPAYSEPLKKWLESNKSVE